VDEVRSGSLQAGGRDIGGLFDLNGPNTPPGDVAAQQAVSLGATLHVPLQDIPGVGRFGGITSPQGVKFYVIKYMR